MRINGKDVKYLRVKDLVDMFGVAESTIRYWRNVKGLPFIKINGRARFVWADVQKWIKSQNKEEK